MRTTRIFQVVYFFNEVTNGKREPSYLKETKSVVAKDATEAIEKVKAALIKSKSSFIDDETKKKVSVSYAGFDPVNVTIEAETDL